MTMASEDPAHREFFDLMDNDTAKILRDNGYTCITMMMANVLEVALYHDPKGRWYIKTLDFTDCEMGEDTESKVKFKKYYNLQNNFVGMWEFGDARNSSIGRRLLTSYREMVDDPDAPMCHQNNHGGRRGLRRTSTWFLPIELLPYILTRFELYTVAPRPEYEPIWQVIRRMRPLPACPFDMIKPTSSATVRRKRIPTTLNPDAPSSSVNVAGLAGEERELSIQEELARDDERLGNRPTAQLVSRIRYLGKRMQLFSEKATIATAEKDRALASQGVEIHRLRNHIKRLGDIDESYKELKQRYDIEKKQWQLSFEADVDPDEPLTAGDAQVFFSLTKARQMKEVRIGRAAVKYSHMVGKQRDRLQAENDALRGRLASETVGTQTDDSYRKEIQERDMKIAELNEQLASIALPLSCENQRLVCGMPAIKGRLSEDQIFESLKSNASKDCNVLLTRKLPYHADFMLIYREKGKICGYALIDAKNYEGSVGGSQIVKLQNDITHCTSRYSVPPIWAGIISLESDVSHSGIGHAPDFLFESVRVHLVHHLRKSSGNCDSILSLLETGLLDVEAAHTPSLHYLLPEDIRTKRDLALQETEQELREQEPTASRAGRAVSVTSSHGRAMSAGQRARRADTIRRQDVTVQFRLPEPLDSVQLGEPLESVIGDAAEVSSSPVRQCPTFRVLPTHVNQVLKIDGLIPSQLESRNAILEAYSFDPSASGVTKKELARCIATSRGVKIRWARQTLAVILEPAACSTRVVYGLVLKK